MSRPPTFISCSEAEQTNELREFLSNFDIKNLPEECHDNSKWVSHFIDLLPFIGQCFDKESISSDDLSNLLVTVATMILLIPNEEQLVIAVNSFCQLYITNLEMHSEKIAYRLFPLDILFKGTRESNHVRYVIYVTIVDCARKCKAHNSIITDPEEISKWLTDCACNEDESRALWRKLYEMFAETSDSKKSFEYLIRLLQSYSESNATKGRDDAIKCILSFIKDPNVIVYDQLLPLKPVQFLEGEPIYNLLQLFVSGDLKAFDQFIKRNQKLMAEHKLNEKNVLHKIKILSFMQMSNGVSELDYEVVKSALQLNSDMELQAFIVEVVRLKCVSCKLDEMSRKITVVGALPRSFGIDQWKQLRDNLASWQCNLSHVGENLQQMLNPVTAE